MVELAVHQEPLHQVDVFLAGGAGTAERAAFHCCNRFYTCLHGLARLVQATRTLGEDREETSGEGGKMESNGGGGDQTRSQDFRMWTVHSV